MISKREYFSIVLTMLAVFLLFMGTQLGKELLERDDPGARAVETGLSSETAWSGPAKGHRISRNVAGVVFLGSKDSPGAGSYVMWGRYAKRTVTFASSPKDKACADASLLLVPGRSLAADRKEIESLMKNGVNVLCLSLPSEKEIRRDDKLRELLGISSIHRKKIRLDGIRLFGGFLLGGERIYLPEDKAERRERQDLPVDTPWYIVRAGTETYMRGILNDADAKEAKAAGLKSEDLPAVIWRHHVGEGELFAVNGPYMEDAEIAGGIVQAVLSKIETTYIYPVVDAQVFSLLDFPAISDDNSEELISIYGRDITDICRNIILPSLVYLPNRYGIHMTAFAAPGLDQSGLQQQDEDMVDKFRKEIHSLHGEFALSLRGRDDASLAKRIADADAALSGGKEPVDVSSVWIGPEELDKLARADTAGLPGLKTVVTRQEKGSAPLDYLGDDITVQRVSDDVSTHTYMQDIRLICRETSMGYDSCYCDFDSIWHPKDEDDRWQKYSDKALSDLITYRRPFEAFESVTASDCDAKLRRYLMTDYDYTREGDVIEITLPLVLTEASFVLRLNDETVTDMEGGTFTQIEDDAYLLRVSSAYIRISVEPSEPLGKLSE